MNRVIFSRNSGWSDSPSVSMIPATFRGSTWRKVDWTVKSVGKISSVSLSMTDTGMPELINRICVPWLVRGEGGKQRCTFQGTSGVSGLTSLPAGSGKLDSASPSEMLNLSMSKISGTMWVVETCCTGSGISAVFGYMI